MPPLKPLSPAPLAPADADPGAAYDVPAALAGLPELMIEVAQVAGLEAAWRLFAERGGNRVYIPGRAGDGHWLVALVGRQAADRICDHFANGGRGMEIELPRGPTGLKGLVHRQLREMIAEGRTSPQITRALGISRDMVKDHRRKMRAEAASPQLDLFRALEATAPTVPLLPQLGGKRRT